MSINAVTEFKITCPQPAHVESLRSLWKEAFGDSDEFLDNFFGIAFSPQRCRAVTMGDEVLGALYIFDCLAEGQKIAYIYAVATRKKARGQGICKKLMDDTHAYLRDSGYKGAILVPSEASLFAFYKRVGYETCSAVAEFEAVANGEVIPVKKIEKSEYLRNRQKFLPQNSVLQEDANIDFLATYASFYVGDDFVLAAYKSEDKLHGVELLGNTANAPQILRALGCKEGTFRTAPQFAPKSADVRPFAMYCSSDKTTPPPEYFGIAFD